MPDPADWTPKRWRRASDLLDALLDLPAPERRAYVDAHTPYGSLLRADVLRLLAREVSDFDAIQDAHLDNAADLLASSARSAPSLPDTFGPFRVVERVGVGGMGAVYRCERADGTFEQPSPSRCLHSGVEAGVD